MADRDEADDRSAKPVDIHVGSRIRIRRKVLGMSQDHLAKALGLTFQQVQKYERGSTRVSASKLYDVARTLQVPVTYFFDGLDDPTRETGTEIDLTIQNFLMTPEGLGLASYFPRIRRPEIRNRIMELIRTMIDDSPDEEKKGRG